MDKRFIEFYDLFSCYVETIVNIKILCSFVFYIIYIFKSVFKNTQIS